MQNVSAETSQSIHSQVISAWTLKGYLDHNLCTGNYEPRSWVSEVCSGTKICRGHSVMKLAVNIFWHFLPHPPFATFSPTQIDSLAIISMHYIPSCIGWFYCCLSALSLCFDMLSCQLLSVFKIITFIVPFLFHTVIHWLIDHQYHVLSSIPPCIYMLGHCQWLVTWIHYARR